MSNLNLHRRAVKTSSRSPSKTNALPGRSFKSLIPLVRDNLSKSRFEHSLAVSDLAARWGRIHGWSPEEARRAGLLHDWVKEWPAQRLIRYARDHRVSVPERNLVFKRAPYLLHAYVGAHVVSRKRWGVQHAEIKAIASHTLGALSMSVGEKILYVADLSAKDRRFSQARAVRHLAARNIHQAFREALKVKFLDVVRRGCVVHPLSVKIWNRFIGER